LADRVPTLAPDASLAHGRAGIGLALLDVGRSLGREEWIDKALECWRSPLSAISATLPQSWCRGRSGVVLSRWLAIQRLPDHPEVDAWRQIVADAGADIAMNLTSPTAHPNALSLCCGVTGQLAMLRLLGQNPSENAWDEVARAMSTGQHPPSLGMWTGISGLVIARHAPAAVLARLIG
jgi:lantibiotic modifying enzyme